MGKVQFLAVTNSIKLVIRVSNVEWVCSSDGNSWNDDTLDLWAAWVWSDCAYSPSHRLRSLRFSESLHLQHLSEISRQQGIVTVLQLIEQGKESFIS